MPPAKKTKKNNSELTKYLSALCNSEDRGKILAQPKKFKFDSPHQNKYLKLLDSIPDSTKLMADLGFGAQANNRFSTFDKSNTYLAPKLKPRSEYIIYSASESESDASESPKKRIRFEVQDRESDDEEFEPPALKKGQGSDQSQQGRPFKKRTIQEVQSENEEEDQEEEIIDVEKVEVSKSTKKGTKASPLTPASRALKLPTPVGPSSSASASTSNNDDGNSSTLANAIKSAEGASNIIGIDKIDNGGKKKKYVESFQLPDEKKMVNISKPTLESGFVEATVKYGPQNYISSAWIRNTNSKTGESYSYKGLINSNSYMKAGKEETFNQKMPWHLRTALVEGVQLLNKMQLPTAKQDDEEEENDTDEDEELTDSNEFNYGFNN